MHLADYRLCDHTEVPDLVRQLTELTNLAFGDYEGAMQLSREWTAWYLRRPGTDPALCQAALLGEQMVSNVLVCVQPVKMGLSALKCGIVDSVATHPDHRRRGLARALMERAHRAMQEVAGVDAGLLYTNPDDHPYRFYRRLGYETRAHASLLAGSRPETRAESLAEIAPEAAEQPLFDLLNGFFAAHEGYSPMSADLWGWHKCERPASNPLSVVIEEAEGRPVATATFADAEVLIGGERSVVSVAYDVAAEGLTAHKLAGLLAAAPHAQVQMILDRASPEYRLATELGLRPVVPEVAMLLPLSEAGRRAAAESGRPWYPMIESIIGV
jgi:GNAT superfamily N-acetyltransferase